MAESFQRVRAATDVSAFTPDQQQVVWRLVHSGGNPDLATQVRFSDHAIARATAAAAAHRPILCDVEMVKHGITAPAAPRCFLHDPRTRAQAEQHGETRSMAAVSLWQPYLAGSITVIGNAPTALFRLIELLQGGAEKPAIIIGMPVGFVGAAEAKDLLWQQHRHLGVECITLTGRAGGSALAASAVNSLLRLQPTA